MISMTRTGKRYQESQHEKEAAGYGHILVPLRFESAARSANGLSAVIAVQMTLD